MNLDLSKKIEALLFYRGEVIEKKELLKIFEVDKDSLNEAIENLKSSIKDRGVVVIETENSVAIGTHPDMSKIIEEIEKKEREGELGKASLETLTVVLYNSPVSRREIDYIRGVQSQYILRLLTARGLIEKEEKGGVYLYSPSVKLLSHLGISKIDELPDFEKIGEKLNEASNDAVEEKEDGR